jgi:triosephosphate isomerase
MMSRVPLIAGNWKMNTNADSAVSLASSVADSVGSSDVDVLLCPPHPFLTLVRDALSGSPVLLGAQNCSDVDSGAFTGEVSVSMLASVGCSHVIVGHSERRGLYGEDDELVARKVRAALDGGLVPILCVGESLEQRNTGATEQVVQRQFDVVFDSLNDKEAGEIVIAYEPIWAIGTGRNATPDQAQAVHSFLRGLLASRGSDLAAVVRILYGGSVKSENAEELLSQNDVDGALVGGASLRADSFAGIVHCAGT